MSRNPLCDGYIHPEWALIFMLRLGLIAVQMMHENTQSSKLFRLSKSVLEGTFTLHSRVALHRLVVRMIDSGDGRSINPF